MATDVERMAQCPMEWLERQIALHERAVRNDMEMLSRLREAVKLKSGKSGPPPVPAEEGKP